MAGLIKNEDIAKVRERTRIDEIVAQHVTLRPAGVGSLKGLCPFHDERTPSFHVRPHLGLWHCFGCGEGGDAISFVQKIDHLSFTDAVEYLAGKAGVQLRYESADGSAARQPSDFGRRQRLLDANRAAAEYFVENLQSQEAATARQFLTSRGFTSQHATDFGVGYAPRGWDGLYSHLRQAGFSDADLITAGLVSQGKRGVYDRFRGRLIWPIRDTSGQVIGFGARHLYEDDPGPKYLNTPETPLYKKSQVLYGIDRAKKEIASQRQVVVVEGYTDVMAMHVAGITSAVATCGTAFGPDHIRVVRRMMGDTASSSSGVILASGRSVGGEVIFTFDGDEAGQKAALRAFEQDQQFAAQTFVAVEHRGMDPCDLRLSEGDQALHALLRAREPLFRFALRTALANLDLDTAEGRVAGLRMGAPVVAQIRDHALRGEYARLLSGWINMDLAEVRRAVQQAPRRGSSSPQSTPTRRHHPANSWESQHPGRDGHGGDHPGRNHQGRNHQGETTYEAPVADFRALFTTNDPTVRTQRQGMEVALQLPAVAHQAGFDQIDATVFTVPALQELAYAISALGGVAGYSPIYYRLLEQEQQRALAEGRAAESVDLNEVYRQSLTAWAEAVRAQVGPELAGLVTQLAVAPFPHDQADEANAWAAGIIRALNRYSINREVSRLRGQLQRLPGDDPRSVEIFGQLIELDKRKRELEEE